MACGVNQSGEANSRGVTSSTSHFERPSQFAGTRMQSVEAHIPAASQHALISISQGAYDRIHCRCKPGLTAPCHPKSMYALRRTEKKMLATRAHRGGRLLSCGDFPQLP